jgi:RNA polymerase sigma-70 factor (ECF subfamily)
MIRSTETTPMTREALMAAYVAGNEQAFLRLFAELAPRIHAFFRRSFGADPVADDLMQQTFLKLHQGRRQFRADAPVLQWAFAIAARVRLDELRRRYRQPLLDEDGLDAVERTPAAPVVDPALAAEVAASVRSALDELPASQRVVVHLHRYEGMSFAEIGKVLGTSEGAVRIRAFRAYERLRDRLRPFARGGEST